LLLNNALKQTGWQGPQITENNWHSELIQRLREFDWNKVIIDVKPFIEKQNELNMITKDNIINLVKNRQ
jgi:hypothetical protein